MNSSCAISRLVLPAAASRATRSSLAVRASRPVIASRRGLAPAAMSSARAWPAMRRAPPVMRQVKPALQLSPRLRALAGPAQRRTVVGERAGQLDRRLRALEHRDRLAEQAETSFPARGQALGAKRDTQRPGPPESACRSDHRLGEPPGLDRVAEERVRDRCLGAPFIEGVDDPEPFASLAAGQEIQQRLLASSLSHAQLSARHQVGRDHDRM